MTETLKLERCELRYTNISPFRLQAVAQAERARYIREELDGVEPAPPSYTVQLGGGVMPNGTELRSWEESHEYTKEHIDTLREELDTLSNRPPTPTMQARLFELRSALIAWDAYQETLNKIGTAIRKKRWEVGLWHTFKENLPIDDAWIKELEADGIDPGEIPTDERERLVYWLEKVAVSTQDEFNTLLYTVDQDYRALEMVQEARRVTREMFQRSLGQQNGAGDR